VPTAESEYHMVHAEQLSPTYKTPWFNAFTLQSIQKDIIIKTAQ
jgi:hypothetical protein